MTGYTAVDVAYPFRLRGTNQQTNTGLLYTPPSYLATQRGGNPVSSSSLLLRGLDVGVIELHNRSGSTVICGFGGRLANDQWGAGQWTNSVFTDGTSNAQGSASNAFSLETNVIGDGFAVHAMVPFNALSINVTTASAGGIPLRQLFYSNSAGTGWTQYGATGSSGAFIFDGEVAPAGFVTGEAVIAWAPPTDWGATASGGIGGIPGGRYAIRVVTSTAPGGATASAKNMEVFRLYWLTANVANNALMAHDFGSKHFRMDPNVDGLVALFSVLSYANRVTAQVVPSY